MSPMVLGQQTAALTLNQRIIFLCGGWQAQIREHTHLFRPQMHLEIDLNTLGDISELGGVFPFHLALTEVSLLFITA